MERLSALNIKNKENIIALAAFGSFETELTHDYYKRDRVEEDIIKCCFSEMMYLQIFLEVTDLQIHLKTEKI
jgi:hypothetical protein